jgi:translation initiation factor IF-1
MSTQIDTNDPFLTLLTDALRAGPGSPEWHQAVSHLKMAGENVDEYKLLIDAREALESGRDYRTVRAGPGFTRKLLNELDRPKAPGPGRFHLATLIASVAGIVILAIVGIAIYELYPRTPVDDSTRAVNELASTYFSKEVGSATFENGIPATWRTIGSLPLETAGGLKPASTAAPAAGDYIGGGIVLSQPVPAVQPIALQATLRVTAASPEIIPQVFAANDPDFSSDRATSSQEVVWQLQGDMQKVVVNGKMQRQARISSKTEMHLVRLLLKGDLVIVEVDGQRWSGRNELGDKPRHLGVRFIRTAGRPAGDMAFTNVRVLAANQ